MGPNYKNYRGGIGAVLSVYSEYFSPFNFVATYPEAKLKYKLGSLPIYIFACCNLFFTLLLQRNIRLVHIHSAAKGSFYRKYGVFLIAKYLFHKKVIFHSHGSELKDFYQRRTGLSRCMFRHFIEMADCIICLSAEWKQFYDSNFTPRKIVILENIVERPKKYANGTTCVPYISFLFLGFIGSRKGVFDLLEVIVEHKSALKGKAKFYIGGNGEVDRLIEMIGKYDLQEIVNFTGWVDTIKKQQIICDCDVYILPSYNEGLPISILEAMSYGKPVISTIVGGIPEVVKNDRNGFLIKPGDKIALWNAIQHFLVEPDLAKIMGNYSLSLIEPYFAKNVINKLGGLYSELLNDS